MYSGAIAAFAEACGAFLFWGLADPTVYFPVIYV